MITEEKKQEMLKVRKLLQKNAPSIYKLWVALKLNGKKNLPDTDKQAL